MPNLTAKIKGTKEFKSALSGIQSLMEEVTFIANEDGINYMGLDPSGISFIDVNFPKDVFEEYKVDGETKLNIRSNEFLDVIKRAKVNDIITFSIIEHSGTLSIEWGAKKFGVRMLNLLEDARGGKRPTIEFETKAIMNSSDFADIVKDIGTVSEVAIPITVTGIATRKPAKGPAIPTSKSAFLFGMGSLLEIKAPNVPILKLGTIGGIGMKNGSDVLIPCFFEIK